MTTETPTTAAEAPLESKPSMRPLALVTGASAGIGEEFARQLAKRGYDLVLVARRRDRLEALAKELEHTRNAKVEVIDADLSTAEGVAKVEERLGKGDVRMLVNNGGLPRTGDSLICLYTARSG
jgi:short-subunit dehydrogenase